MMMTTTLSAWHWPACICQYVIFPDKKSWCHGDYGDIVVYVVNDDSCDNSVNDDDDNDDENMRLVPPVPLCLCCW